MKKDALYSPGGPPEDSPLVAWDRPGDEPCEAGTVGCSVSHAATAVALDCLPW
jgi:hypothetical protein